MRQLRKLAVLAALTGLIGFLCWRLAQRSPATPPTAPVSVDIPATKITNAATPSRAVAASQLKPDDPLVVLLGEGAARVSPETRSRLLQACCCARLLQREADKLPPDSVRNQITGLQKLLFRNDFTVAAWSDPGLDCHEADAVYQRLGAWLQNGESQTVVPPSEPVYNGLPLSDGLAALQENYQSVLNPTDPGFVGSGFSNVLATVNQYASTAQALSSMLYHDACVFSDFMATYRRWRRDDVNAVRSIEASLGLAATGLNSPDQSTASDEAVAGSPYGTLEESYRAAYAYRFSNYYGLDGNAVATALEQIPMSSTWNILSVPACPGAGKLGRHSGRIRSPNDARS